MAMVFFIVLHQRKNNNRFREFFRFPLSILGKVVYNDKTKNEEF